MGEKDRIGSATIGNVVVSWRDFNVLQEKSNTNENVMFSFSGGNELKPSDPGYTGCWSAMNNYAACQKAHGEIKLTRAQTIQLANNAMKSHPVCSWEGFDETYDLRVRSAGALASFTDTRMLFARISCTN
ncbi:hypothetical protein [Leisingera sp. MMG026]|uniref:hypothetical protein n=1 Tax=Leisingera sp. MMG026 TaxID=2909982 RepID=UPI001F29FA1E|nr:hypothetical protein [Leisingera sp. MMG026]MCF6432445.1 hypothetical protein [Leisingera sp. MMG026]